jgi:hypothetical protein
MNTLLFSVGIAVFMITVYGTVMVGGMTMQQHQRDDLADDIKVIVNDDGFDVITSTSSNRIDHSKDTTAKP